MKAYELAVLDKNHRDPHAKGRVITKFQLDRPSRGKVRNSQKDGILCSMGENACCEFCVSGFVVSGRFEFECLSRNLRYGHK